LDDIARTIGDRHDTVRRLYRGLMVLEQAEKTGRFARADAYKSRFAFSHLWTGLGYSGIQRFLGIKPETGDKKDPVAKSHVENLIELCRWLYGSKENEIPPLIRSQNPDLRNLDEALQTNRGVAALQAGLPLDTSVKVGRGDERLFTEALVSALKHLRDAESYRATGYQGDEDMLNSAQKILTIAQSMVEDMQQVRESHVSKDIMPTRKRKK
jgi:hypothetical protein